MTMGELESIKQSILAFRDARDWEKYHNPKDLAISLSVEAGELLETFLWKSPEEASKEAIADELADVFYCAFLLAHEMNFDIKEIIATKMKTNAQKYPVDKAKGSNLKWDELS